MPVPKTVEPETDMTMGNVLPPFKERTLSAMRPPHPVGTLESALPVRFTPIWSECEKSWYGFLLVFWRYCCRVMFSTRVPTLATTARSPAGKRSRMPDQLALFPRLGWNANGLPAMFVGLMTVPLGFSAVGVVRF